jgi:acetyl-CoA acetyltransferase
MAATPVVIGVGDILNRSTRVEDAKEPAQLMYEAIIAAIKDSNPTDPSRLQASIDSIDVVKTWTWPYPDLPGLLAERLKFQPKHKQYSEHGGNQPGRLLDEAARRISKGEVQVAVVTGGEALASRAYSQTPSRIPILDQETEIRHSLCVCSRQETSTTWVGKAFRSRRFGLHPYRTRFRRQYDIFIMAISFRCSFRSRSRGHS